MPPALPRRLMRSLALTSLVACGSGLAIEDAGVVDGGASGASDASDPGKPVEPGGGEAGPPDAPPGVSPSPCGGARVPVPSPLRTLWVATDGNDTTGDGSQSKPFGSLAATASRLRPGDLVSIRAGTYRPRAPVFFDGIKGTSAAPIRIAPAPGEKVTIDGSAATLARGAGLITLSNVAWVVLEGLEVTGSSQALVHVEQGDHATLRDLRVHGAKGEGILLVGRDLVAEDNEIWDVANVNSGGVLDGGWPGGIDTFHAPDGALTTGLVVRRNKVHDVWGECIISAFVEKAAIVDNEVRNCFSTGIYGDHTRDLRIERNLVSVDSRAYDINGVPMTGIDLAVERYGSRDPAPFPIDRVVVANNVLARVGTAMGFSNEPAHNAAGNSYGDLVFSHNVVWRSTDAAFRFSRLSALSRAAGPVRIVNNILVSPMAYDVRGARITALANCYEVAELGDLADPKALRGACGIGAPPSPLSLLAFRPGAGAKVKGGGAPEPAVPLDAFCAKRSEAAPSIGVAE